jgi:isoquinoline 1-oxidoreductase alpha subunit
MAITLHVNGTDRQVDADPGTPLLWVLRDTLQLTGTKFGCGIAQCGACTVHLDGQPARACVTPIKAVGTRKIVTIEGVQGPTADAIKNAWVDINVPQCGYCQSGQVMSAIALLTARPQPTDAEIDAAMTGNVCRCATYARVRAAIHQASRQTAGTTPKTGV